MNLRKYFDNNRFPEVFRLGRETVIYGFGYAITNLSAFLLLPLYLKYLSPEEYGLFSLSKAVPNLIIAFLTLNLNSALIRFYYEWKEKKCEREAVFTILSFMGAWLAVASFILLYWGPQIFSVLLKSVPFAPYLKISVWTQIIGISLIMLNHLMRIKGEMVRYSVLNNVLFLLTVGFSIYFVAYKHWGVEGALYGGLVANLLMLFPVIYYLLKNITPKFNLRVLSESISFSVPQLPATMVGYFFSIADRFFLDKFVPVAQIGVYALAKTVASIVPMISGVFQFCLVPFYMRVAASRPDHREIIGSISRYFIYFSAFLTMAIAMFAPEVISLLGKTKYMAATAFVGPLALISLIESLALFPNVQIQLSKLTKYTSLIAAMNLGIFLTVGYPLVSKYAINGVMVSYLITDLAVIGFSLYLGHKLYPMVLRYSKVFVALGTGVALVLGGYFSGAIDAMLIRFILLAVFLIAVNWIERSKDCVIVTSGGTSQSVGV